MTQEKITPSTAPKQVRAGFNVKRSEIKAAREQVHQICPCCKKYWSKPRGIKGSYFVWITRKTMHEPEKINENFGLVDEICIECTDKIKEFMGGLAK